MLIEHITDRLCRYCKARIKGEKHDCLHTNGYWNEYRTFKCGRTLHFSPNFMRVEVETECPTESKEKRRLKFEHDKAIIIDDVKQSMDKKFIRKLMKALREDWEVRKDKK